MTPQNQPPMDIDLSVMESLIEDALTILGKDWFSRRLNKDNRNRDAIRNKDHDRQRVRHSAAHVLIQWYVEYEAWRGAFSLDNGIPISQSALLLVTFASNLVKVKNITGLDPILARLRKPAEFLATAFEVEVATYYLNGGHQVEFVEIGIERSPDLKVISDDGKVLWVECKYRDEMTGRDKQISQFWEQLQDTLYRNWGPTKTNVALVLKSACDPVPTELQGIVDAVLQSAKAMLKHPDRNRLEVQGKSSNEKYRFTLNYLADPDHEQPLHRFSDLGSDWFSWMFELMHDGDGNSIVRNPKFFGFFNANPPDKYIGVLNSFSSAVGQIPESGPGAIWIRVPYPTDDSRAQADLEAMAAKLQKELAGSHNTRVNSVTLSARVFSNEQNEGHPGLAYRHVSATIAHKNPRYEM